MYLMNIIEFFQVLTGMEEKYLCPIILFWSQRMRQLTDAGMLMFSTSIPSELLVFSNVMLCWGAVFPK